MVFTTFSGRCTHASLDSDPAGFTSATQFADGFHGLDGESQSLGGVRLRNNGHEWFVLSEAGVVQCDDPKQDIEVRSDSKKIFCFYSAQCTPVTRKLKAAVLKELDKSDWSKLTDDEINRTVIRLAASGSLTGLEITQTSVQCLGDKTSNGNPDCPKVNDCVNNRRGSSLYWKVKPLKVLAAPPTAADSDGFQVEQRGGSAPRGVSR